MGRPAGHRRSLPAALVLAASTGPWRSSWRQTELGFAAAGAALHELALIGRIAVTHDTVLVRAADRCADPAAELLLEHLLLADRAHPPRRWVERTGSELLDVTRAELVAEGLLVPVTRRLLGLFPVREYLHTGTGPEGEQSLIGAGPLEARDRVVAGLLQAIHHPAGAAPARPADPVTDAVASAVAAARYILGLPG